MDSIVQFFTHIRETYRPRRGWRRTFIYIGVIFVAAVILFGLLYSRFFGPMDKYGTTQEFIVRPGESYTDVVNDLRHLGYIRSITAFKVAYTATGNLRGIREGGYKISASEDAWTIAYQLAQPPYLAWITFPTGLRKEQIADTLAKKLSWTPEEKAPNVVIQGNKVDENGSASSTAEEEHGYTLPESEEWSACFLIALDKNGVAHATADVEGFLANKHFIRAATVNDFWLGAAQLQRDLDQINVAQRVMINMQMAATAIQEQMEADQLAQKVMRSDLSMNKRPPR